MKMAPQEACRANDGSSTATSVAYTKASVSGYRLNRSSRFPFRDLDALLELP